MITIREAVRSDNDALVDLMARCPQGTNLVVRLDRAPDFFARSQPYEAFQTYVADDDGKLVGVGECSIRTILKNGRALITGYGYSYAVDSSYRGHRLAQRLEEACTEYALSAGAEQVFGWILEDNTPSLKAFGRIGYADERVLNVYAFLPYRQQNVPAGVRPMQDKDLEQVADILNHTYADYDYYYPYTPDTLTAFLRRLPGFSTDDYYVYEKDGEIVSCLGCWDYSKAINGTIIRLSRQLGIISGLVKFLRIFGRVPRVPEIGKNWAYCVPELPGYRNSPDDLIPLWKQMNNFAVKRNTNVIMFPLDPRSDLVQLTRQGLHVKIGLHQVMRPLTEKAIPSTRLIYADPIDI
jgi:L-amino acid N-acyltransferase YncA